MTVGVNWINLAGVVNMRDLGGRVTAQGRELMPHRLLRSDNLAELPESSIQTLLTEYELSDVIDLRTAVERELTGPAAIEDRIALHCLSLYPESGFRFDPAGAGSPWAELYLTDADLAKHFAAVAKHYLEYLINRPDSVITALRVIAGSAGAVVVNCAAGKDRTGTIIALALAAVGVPIDQIAADYQASTERLPQILERLGVSAAAGSVTNDLRAAKQATPPEVIFQLFDLIDEEFGGLEPWLVSQGWTAADQQALEEKLLS